MPEITIPSPIGLLAIEEENGLLVALHWRRARKESPTPLLQQAAEQLAEYFAKTRREFDLPMKPAGSQFERAVWDAMLHIPYGQTRSYGEVARDVGGEARDVGAACGSNPLPILIPCHRILAGGGRLGGYSGKGGSETKTLLPTLEGALPGQGARPSPSHCLPMGPHPLPLSGRGTELPLSHGVGEGWGPSRSDGRVRVAQRARHALFRVLRFGPSGNG